MKTLLVLPFFCATIFAQFHTTYSPAGNTVALTAIINTTLGTEISDLTQMFDDYYVAVYPQTDTAIIYFDSDTTTAPSRILRNAKFTFLGLFKAASFPDLWLYSPGYIDIDVWKK